MKMGIFLKKIYLLLLSAKLSTCTITGITYMDPIKLGTPPKTDAHPCNPLYWYPRALPGHCYLKTTGSPPRPPVPPAGVFPLPIPVPMPKPVPMPVYPPVMPLPQAPFPLPPPIPSLIPPAPPQLPFGLPLLPSNPMLPVSGMPYPLSPLYPPLPTTFNNYPPRRPIGMVPGIPGLVSGDGGINILPFSDVYSDMLEKHKNKLIRRKIRKLYRDYDNYPNHSRRRRYRKRIAS